MPKQPSKIGRVTKKILRFSFFTFLAVIILLNLFIVLSGRFYLYKGIANTYLVGQAGPSIYERDIFAYTTIQNDKVDQWETHADLNNYQLSKKDQQFMESLGTKAFLVFRGDTLLYEKYWDSHKKSTVSNSFSAAKTVVALLIGIAIEDGSIKSLDEPVGNYLKAYKSNGKEKITIRHLLMMASGLDWQESAKNPLSENAESYYGSDLWGLVNRQKAIEEPGKTFKYQSGNSQLLGFIIEKATGKTVSEYTEEKLWKKIGAEQEAYWSLDKENGDEKSFCCLYASARDFGRLGKLILNKGKVGNETIVPEWYMNEMTKLVDMGTEEGIPNQRYGLHIWLYNNNNNPIMYCRGIKGQYIANIPSEKLTIVRIGMERKDNFVLPKNFKEVNRKLLEDKVGHPKDFFEYMRVGQEISKAIK